MKRDYSKAKVAFQPPLAPIEVGTENFGLVWYQPDRRELELIEICNQEFLRLRSKFLAEGKSFLPIGIKFNYRQKSTGGYAKYVESTVDLNFRLLNKNRYELLTVFVHELCHLWSYQLYGKAGEGHGYYWQQVMLFCGYRPERCHTMDHYTIKR